jgi:hypothetical protein
MPDHRPSDSRAVSVAWQMGSPDGGWRMSLFSFTFDPRAFVLAYLLFSFRGFTHFSLALHEI